MQGAARTSYRPDYTLQTTYQHRDARLEVDEQVADSGLESASSAMPPVDPSSTTTPNLWSTLPSTSVLASKREETVQKAFSSDDHEPGDARLGHATKGSPRRKKRQCVGTNQVAMGSVHNSRVCWLVSPC